MWSCRGGSGSSTIDRGAACNVRVRQPTRRPRRRPGPTGGPRQCGFRHGEKLPCKGSTTPPWPPRGCLHASETMKLPRVEGPRGHATSILGLEFRRRDLSSRRLRELDTKPDHRHRSTLGRGRQRQAGFKSCRRGGKGSSFRSSATRHPKSDCEERRGGSSTASPIT